MIRRELTAPNDSKLWLLISQVEHARVSGAITEHWREPCRPEVVEAIAHHDDGWAAWEAEPKLNPDLGAPFSFLEMPVPVALVIWDHSIAAAEKFGPLAAHIVAGHFYSLLSESENAADPLAVAWLTAKRKQRTSSLDAWMRTNPAGTLQDAKQAQHMLMLADLFSLWLCCDCPATRGAEMILEQSAMKLRTGSLLSQFDFTVADFRLQPAGDSDRVARLDWTVAVQPCPFITRPLPLSAQATLVPVHRYESWQELKSASWPVALHWRLTGPAATDGETLSYGRESR